MLKNDDYYKKLNEHMPEVVTLNGHHVLHVPIGNEERMHANQRKSKRLERRKRNEDAEKLKPKDV